ncbi:probable glutamate--tRNA ligase, mitochondrial isoform X1 [Octopus sinensis]|uniref:Nondiscriminating glutamyl-tRNA synthetase EARS2, mitochondrial n=2 Tax=Octopus sinensis TaxID=2607531 RepID=A0A6P7S942_9MOLL|nr:probable glutamate--tRNA ligase, mitochondrial isoform X1 [Octopus sinensis]
MAVLTSLFHRFQLWNVYQFGKECHLSKIVRWSHTNVRVRFAPSPTGFLHLGGLRSALYNYIFAKSKGGTFILRIEDTDQTRLVPGALEKLQDSLEWAGIMQDEGPRAGGKYGPYIQSERCHIYQEKIQILLENGSAYRCFCSNKRIELIRRAALSRGETPKYDNKCQHLTQKEIDAKMKDNIPYVIRFKLKLNETPWEDVVHGTIVNDIALVEGDPILIKSDQFPTYHFANVVDDHTMAVSHVLRGVEWQSSTPKHIQIYEAFGWKPPVFAHMPLLVNKDGTKLSKRQGDIHVEHFKDQGYYPESILNFICHVGGGFGTDQTAGMSFDDLISKFSLEKLKKTPGRLEFDKISRFNHETLIQKIQGNERHEILQQVLKLVSEKYGSEFIENNDERSLQQYLEAVVDWAKVRINRIEDLLLPEFKFIWVQPSFDDIKNLSSFSCNCQQVLESTIELLETDNHFKPETISKLLHNHVKELQLKFKTYMHLLRYSISGRKEGPGVVEMISLLGQKQTVERLKLCLEHIKLSQT